MEQKGGGQEGRDKQTGAVWPERGTKRLTCVAFVQTVGFHNFNLRNYNLRVSNPNKLIVDVFLT